MKLPKYFIARIAGLSANNITDFNWEQGEALMDKILEYQTKISEVSNKLSENLYGQIGKSKGEEKIRLIQFRRDMFNSKKIHPNLETFVKGTNLELCYLLISLRAELIQFEKSVLASYEIELSRVSNQLAKISENENLQKGLLLSSPTFFTKVKSLKKGKLDKKSKNTYLEIYKYLSRVCTKTSPFSSFTKISTLRYGSNYVLQFKSQEQKDYIKINNCIYDLFMKSLSRDKKIKYLIPIRLNPYLLVGKDIYCFVKKEGRIDHIREVKRNEVLDQLNLYLEENKQKNLNQLTKYLNQIIDETQSDISNYLNNLIAVGFIEFDFGIKSMNSDWGKELLELLNNYASKTEPIISKKYITAIKNLAQLERQFSSMNIEERYEKIHTVYDYTRNFLNSTRLLSENEIKALSTKSLLYEDIRSEYSLELNKNEIAKITSIINDFCSAFRFKSGLEQDIDLKSFFKDRYDANSTVCLIRLFIDYYKKERPNNQFTLDPALVKNCLNEKFKINLEEESFEIHLEFKPFDRLDSKPFSYLASLQQDNLNTERFVINSVSTGFGRSAGRFLGILGNDFEKNLKDIITQSSQKFKLLENKGYTIFNANRHPPILPYILDIFENNGDSTPVKPSNLFVKLENNELRLIDRENNVFLVIDLDLEALNSRNSIYQFLNLFKPPLPVSNKVFNGIINKNYYKVVDEGVIVNPRILLENKVILQRKNWLISKNSIPDTSESDFNFFKSINLFIRKHEIPNEVFISFYSRHERDKLRKEDKLGVKLTDHKPQYFCFSSILSVALLKKQLKRDFKDFTIEEMLPLPKNVGKEYHVNEFQLEWYG